MTSKPSETSPPSSETIENVISEHGKTLAREPSDSSLLEDRLDKLELAIEEIGQKAELVANFNEYVSDLRNDLTAVRKTRFWLVVISLAFLIGADATVLILLFHHGVLFWLQDTYFKSVAFVGVLTASVVLLSIMLKGAFHSLADRKKDDMIPPHMKEGLDALKLLIGK